MVRREPESVAGASAAMSATSAASRKGFRSGQERIVFAIAALCFSAFDLCPRLSHADNVLLLIRNVSILACSASAWRRRSSAAESIFNSRDNGDDVALSLDLMPARHNRRAGAGGRTGVGGPSLACSTAS